MLRKLLQCQHSLPLSHRHVIKVYQNILLVQKYFLIVFENRKKMCSPFYFTFKMRFMSWAICLSNFLSYRAAISCPTAKMKRKKAKWHALTLQVALPICIDWKQHSPSRFININCTLLLETDLDPSSKLHTWNEYESLRPDCLEEGASSWTPNDRPDSQRLYNCSKLRTCFSFFFRSLFRIENCLKSIIK